MSYSGPSSQSQIVYEEVTGVDDKSCAEDTVEYARRIGINLAEEPLLYLAEEGILAQLPALWKPHKDEVSGNWYYYNTETQKSQWEHPMDSTYRDKVLQARENRAAAHLKNFDPSKSRPPKSLPPLKTGGLKPLGPLRNSKPGPLGSLNRPGSSTTTSGLGSSMQLSENDSKPLSYNQAKNIISKSALGPIGQNSLDDETLDETEVELSNTKSSQRSQERKSSGLQLTGLGANFIKGVTTEKNEQQQIKSDLNKKNSSNSLWNFRPNETFTEEERQLWEQMAGDATSNLKSKSRSQSQSVKFNLDENTELRFDSPTSNVQSIEEDIKEKNSKSNSHTSRSDDTSQEDSSDEVSEERKELKPPVQQRAQVQMPQKRVLSVNSNYNQKTSRILDSLGQLSQLGNNNNSTSTKGELGAGEKITEHSDNSMLVDLNTKKNEMRNEMEAQLERFRVELEAEKKAKIENMRNELTKALDQAKLYHEKSLADAKRNLEKSSQDQISKLKRDLEFHTVEELQKAKQEFDDELQRRRAQMIQDHNKKLTELRQESDKLSSKAVLERKLSDDELKQSKESMKEEQRRQIEQMKDYHQSFIAKLREEFKQEEEIIRKEFEQNKKSLLSKASEEIEQLKKSVESDKEKEAAKISKESVKSEEKQIKVASPRKIQSQVEVQTVQNSTRDFEVEELKRKYQQLEEKYIGLRNELGNLVAASGKTQNLEESDLERLEVDEIETATSQSEDIHKEIIDIETIDNGFVSDNASTSKHLSDALKSLEALKSQILNIKAGREEREVEKCSLQVQALATSRRSKPQNSQRKKQIINPEKITRKSKKSENCPNVVNSNGNLIGSNEKFTKIVQISKSRSATQIFETQNEKSSREVLEEAKDFIRSQKHRLQRPITNIIPTQQQRPVTASRFPTTAIPTLTLSAASPYSPRKLNGTEILSETDSSGVGSMKDIQSVERKQISSEIENICTSLNKLDKQMKYMWTLVRGSGQNFESTQNYIPVAMAQNGNLIRTLSKSELPTAYSQVNFLPTTFQPQISAINSQPPCYTTQDIASKYNIPQLLSYENRALIDNLNANSKPNLVTKKNSRDTLFLNSLQNEIKSFKENQERIMSQYLPQDNYSDRIKEKTKDLRDWLDKF